MRATTLTILAVSAVVAACGETATQPAAPVPAVAPVVATASGADQAVGCMAYLSLRQVALEGETPPGDVTAVREAMGAWEGVARAAMTPDEVNQYFASSVAVEDDATPAVVTATSDWCLANKPAA